jgi:hypothetical protein
MKSFQKSPATVSELMIWKIKPTINPRTSRSISDKGKVYNYLEKEYEKAFPLIINSKENNSYKIEDSIDDKDPITLQTFWIIENNIKKVIYQEKNKLILYKDSLGFIRCFERESLEYLKAHKINKHPVSCEEIPENVWKQIVEKNLETERKKLTVEEKAFNIFQKFSSISIFIESEWFTSLEKSKLLKFNYELKDFYHQNFTEIQKNEISSRILFVKTEDNFTNNTKEEVLSYLLDEIDVLLSVTSDELKYMSNYILVGALGIVIPKIKEFYPDFSFSFSV